MQMKIEKLKQRQKLKPKPKLSRGSRGSGAGPGFCYPCSVDAHDDDDDGVADDVCFARERWRKTKAMMLLCACLDWRRAPVLGVAAAAPGCCLPASVCLLCHDWLAKVQIDQRRHATHWGRAASVLCGITCDLLHAIFWLSHAPIDLLLYFLLLHLRPN